MWFLRLLRHPATILFVGGHAAFVLCWTALCLAIGPMEAGHPFLLLFYLDFPVLWLLSEIDGNGLLASSLILLVLGSVQWGLIGMLFAIPDLWNKPRQ